MSQTTTTIDAPAQLIDDSSGRTRRSPQSGNVITRRRTLPGGRAVVGALLITLAAVGVFTAYLRASAPPATTYLVATADIPPGTRISPGVLEPIAIELPQAQADNAFSSLSMAVDALAVAPIRAGDLVLRSALLEADAIPGTSTYTFALPPTRALNGAIVDGERIDIIATEDGSTRYVATNVHVLDRAGSATSDRVILTIAIDDPGLVLAIANAVDTASLHIARTDPDGAPPAATPAAVDQ